MIDEIARDTQERMRKTVEALRHDLMAIRTGRASTALVDRLQVEYYNMPTPLMQLASISVPEAQTILIRPYNPGDIPTIERAIAKSDLGLTPNSDGKVIRLNIPPLTEERRRELSKQVARRAEEARVAARNVRRDAIQDLRDMEKESMITEDELHSGQEMIQDKTNACIGEIDAITHEKEKEIMTI